MIVKYAPALPAVPSPDLLALRCTEPLSAGEVEQMGRNCTVFGFTASEVLVGPKEKRVTLTALDLPDLTAYVYEMECGDTWVSSFPRSEGAYVPCKRSGLGDGPQRLVHGPFMPRRSLADPRFGKDDPVTPVYTVWRRKDGYVAASCSHPSDWGHPHKPYDGAWGQKGFTLLLVTDDWDAAHARIRAERTADAKWEGEP